MTSTVVSVTACVILCCMVAWLGISLIDESDDVQNPQTLVRTEVTIDTSSLPENPTEKDWYPLGVQVLQDNGWDLSPNLTSVGTIVSCEPNPVLDKMSMDFADNYFDGFRPSIKWAIVSLDRRSNTASVWIEYQALQRGHSSPIDLAKVRVGLQEALAIADRHGAQEYRESLDNECEVSIHLGVGGWRIRYRENERSRWEDWIIWVNAGTGEAERR